MERKKKQICAALSWTDKQQRGCCFFSFGDKREMIPKHVHSHATNLLHNPINVMQKCHYGPDAKLKRGRFIVTKLICPRTLNNASKASQLAVIYAGQKYS